jgi:hypothetical protein
MHGSVVPLRGNQIHDPCVGTLQDIVVTTVYGHCPELVLSEDINMKEILNFF